MRQIECHWWILVYTEQTLGVQVWYIAVASNRIFQVAATFCHEVAHACEITSGPIYDYAQVARQSSVWLCVIIRYEGILP